jgi:pimeloyl-ACP methyl ester carboxylesterase
MRSHDLPSNFVQTRDGTCLYWTEWGSGAPVLFLNSAGMCTSMWDYQFTALAEHGLRCLSYDRRGHGRSDCPGQGYDYDTLADDLDSVIKALDLRDLTLIGHSMGGGEIARYLSRHGSSRVARAVFIAATTPFMRKTVDNPHGVPDEAADAVRNSWRQDFPKWVFDNVAPFFIPETSPALMRTLAQQLASWRPYLAITLNKVVFETDLREDLRRMSIPALVIHGDRDMSAPLEITGRATAALIPGCRLEIYAGAPHGIMYTHMDRLHADLLKFIRET